MNDLAELVAQATVDAPEDVVRRHRETRLARFEQPSRTEVVERLPLWVSGTVVEGLLRGLGRRRAVELW